MSKTSGERRRFVMLVPMKARPRRARTKAPSSFLRQALRNLGAFRSAYLWLLADLVAFARRRVAAVFALNLLGVTLQWAVVGAVLMFVGKLTGEGGAFQAPLLGGIDLPVEATFEVLLVWGMIVLLLVCVASASAYGAEAISFETARRYVDSGSRSILLATLEARSRLVDQEEPPARQLQMVLLRDQLMVQRALIVLQRSLRAILMVAVAGVVLALINPILSAVVATVMALSAIPFYLVNQRIVGAAATLQERNARAGAAVIQLVEHATSREPNAEVQRVVPELYAIEGAVADRWNALRDIMLAGQRTSALMSGVVGSALVAVVITFGVLIARDGTSWVAALTFVIGLNFASGAFIQLAGLVTAANRFLPHVQKYVSYVRGLSPAESAGAHDLRTTQREDLPPIRAPHPSLEASDVELALTAGVRALCLWPAPIDRLNVHLLLKLLVAGSADDAHRLREAAFFLGSPGSLPPVSVRALLGPCGKQAVNDLGLAKEVAKLSDGWDTVLTPRIQERLSPTLRYTLGMVEGLGHQLLVLGWKSFSSLRAEDRVRVLEIVAPRPVLFVGAATLGKQPAEVSHMVVLDEHGIAGMGDAVWYKTVAPGLRSKEFVSPPAGAAAGVGLEELADA